MPLANTNKQVDTIVPLDQSHREKLPVFLGKSRGTQRLYEWKYFDESFNRGRLRGVCALKDDVLVGFMGLIPVQLRNGDERVEDFWICDWVIGDPVALKGLGGELVRSALQQTGRLIAYAGSEIARRRWPRHSANYDLQAGIPMKRFLRIGGYLTLLLNRIKYFPELNFLRRIPTAGISGSTAGFVTCEGVHESLPLHHQVQQSWSPYYSLNDLRWRLEACPILQTVSLVSSDMDCGALLWHNVDKPETWKGAVFAPLGSPDEELCLSAATSYAKVHGAEVLTFNCSRLDAPRLRSFKRSGFWIGKSPYPIHFLNVRPEEAPVTLAGLSCLDTDFSYRFH